MRSVLALGLGAASLGLVACGGGGGGSPGGGVVTPPVPPPPTFTKWSEKLKAGAAVVVSGRAQEVIDTYAAGAHTYANSPVGDGTVTQTIAATGDLTGLKLVAGARTLEFAAANGDTFGPTAYNPALTIARGKDGGKLAVFVDPLELGWNYQSLGVWRTGSGGFNASGEAGAVSIGETTVGSSIPTMANAVFRGLAVANYLNGTALPSTLQASVTMTANFASRSVWLTSSSFSDVDTGSVNLGGGGLEGTLTYAPGTNALSGAIRLTNSFDMTGSGSGQFFGPAADELGGQFLLSFTEGAGGRLIGAFGGVRATAPSGGGFNWAFNRQPGATNTLSGQAVTIVRTVSGSTVTAVGAPTTGEATFTETLSTAGALAGLGVTTGGRTVTFSTAAGDTIARGRVNQATTRDGSARAAFSDPTLLAHDYQSYGVWQSGVGSSSNVIGAASTGTVTAGSAIPTTGSAVFRGEASMVLSGGVAEGSFFSAGMTLTTNFAARTADLAVASNPLGGGASTPGVNAALTWAPGTNQLSGTATSSSRGLTGAATARFYGPAAEEVGGTFSLGPAAGSTSLDRLTGAFGGKR